jgi:hypothetical protein
MATSITFNNSTYSVPANREPRGWGTSLSAFLVDVGNNALSKAGGNFTLTADANFGANFGLVVKYIKSASANVAQSGVVRLANDEGIGFRNAANNADKVFKLGSDDKWTFGAIAVSETELDHLVGVTSDIQTQLDAKVDNTDVIDIAHGGTGQTSKTPAFDALAPSTTKGDLIAYDGTDNVRVAVGSNGQVLTADSAQTSGLSWTSPLTNPMTTSGDIIYGGTSGAVTRLAANSTATKKWLRSLSSGVPSWEEVDSVKGATPASTVTTANPPAGYVGEYKETTRSSALSIPVANSGLLGDVDPGVAAWSGTGATGLTLTTGVWDIQGSVVFSPQSGSIALTTAIVAIGTDKQATTTGIDAIRNQTQIQGIGTASGQNFSITTPVFRVSITAASTTYYLKALATWPTAATTINVTGNIRATRVPSV